MIFTDVANEVAKVLDKESSYKNEDWGMVYGFTYVTLIMNEHWDRGLVQELIKSKLSLNILSESVLLWLRYFMDHDDTELPTLMMKKQTALKWAEILTESSLPCILQDSKSH